MRQTISIIFLLVVAFFGVSYNIEPEIIYKERTVYVKEVVDLNAMISAFIMVESSGYDKAIGEKDDVGCLQITPIYVKDVNRIVGYEKYCLNDRYSREKSVEMFIIKQKHYNPGFDLHLACKIHNPLAGLSYHNKVEKYYNEFKQEQWKCFTQTVSSPR